MSATAIWAEDAREIGDTYINSASPTTNFGGAANLPVNDAHSSSLIQFDLTQFPAGTSASNIEQAKGTGLAEFSVFSRF